MRFAYPSFPAEFEIPDAWLDEAGARTLTPGASAFPPDGSADDVIGLTDIAPPHRLTSVPKDFRGFDQNRMVRVLRGLVQGDALPPSTSSASLASTRPTASGCSTAFTASSPRLR